MAGCSAGHSVFSFDGCSLAAARRLDPGDVDLFHLHHRVKHAPGDGGVRIGDPFHQSNRRNLPGHAPFVPAPAALALFAAIADDRVPVTVGFGLVGGGDLERVQ